VTAVKLDLADTPSFLRLRRVYQALVIGGMVAQMDWCLLPDGGCAARNGNELSLQCLN
jgi:hypothetical protein